MKEVLGSEQEEGKEKMSENQKDYAKLVRQGGTEIWESSQTPPTTPNEVLDGSVDSEQREVKSTRKLLRQCRDPQAFLRRATG